MTTNAQSELRVKICTIVSELFDADMGSLDDETSPDTISEWDSMGHIQLISALEQEFGIVFSPEEQMEMLNIGIIVDLLNERLIEN